MSPLDSKFQQLRALDKSQDPSDQEGYKRLRDDIILSDKRQSLPLIVSRSLIKRTPGLSENNDLDDLVSEGTIGLIKAVDRFDPDQRVEFAAYAIPVIHGAMLHYLRDRAGRDESVGQSDPLDVAGSVADPDCGAERRSDIREALAEAFVALEKTLKTARDRAAWARGRRALELRFFEGQTAREIGAAFDISESGACHLIARAKDALKPHLSASLFG